MKNFDDDELREIASLAEEYGAPIVRAEGNGRVTYANPAAREMYGLLNDAGNKIAHPVLLKTLRKIAKNRVEVSNNVEVGNAVYEFNFRPRTRGNQVNIFARDVTGWVATQKALGETQGILSSLSLNTQAAIGVVDLDHNLIFSNELFDESHSIYLQMLEEAKLSKLEELDAMAELIKHSKDVLETGMPIAREQIVSTSRGLRKFLHLKFPIRQDGGEITGIGQIGTDITANLETDLQLEAARREIAENTALLEDALDAMSDGIVIYDADDRQVLNNSAYREIYGYGDDLSPLGNTVEEMLSIDVANGTLTEKQKTSYITQRNAQRKVSAGEFEIQLSNGRWYQIRDRATRTGGTVTIHTDITDRKRMEAAILSGKHEADAEVLRQRDAISTNEKRFRAIVEDQTDMISRSDADLNLTFVNGSYKKTFFGEDVDERNIIGRNILDVIADEDVRAEYRSKLRNLTPEQPIVRTVMLEHVVDGSLQWQAWIDRALFDENKMPIGYQSVGRDITPQKIAEQALASNLKERQAIVDGALDAIISVDSDFNVREVNNAAIQMFGYAKAEMIGQSVLDFVGPKTRKAYMEAFERFRSNQEEIDFSKLRMEIEGKKKDGTIFPVERAVAHVENEGEERFVAFMRDLTIPKQIEAELEQQRKIATQNEKLSAIGSLLANVAHELNNPLAVVIGQADLLYELAGDEKLKRRSERIKAAANRCSGIVKTFLSAVRQKEPENKLFSPEEPLLETTKLLEYSLSTGGIHLTIEIEDDLPNVFGDPNQIGQVLTNLMINARQALDLSKMEKKIAVSAQRSEDQSSILYSVEDNGDGIPEEDLKHIFEPFFTTKEEGSGTGIGLPIVRNILTAHSGDISVLSSPTLGGAMFVVTLPIGGEIVEDSDIAMPAVTVSKVAEKHRILVVDDEIDVAETAADHLVILGYDCETAIGGAVALEKLEQGHFDVVISDLRMPQIDGPNLLEMAEQKWPGISSRFGFFTGDNLNPQARKFLKDKAFRSIEKPFTAASLRGLVVTILDEDSDKRSG